MSEWLLGKEVLQGIEFCVFVNLLQVLFRLLVVQNAAMHAPNLNPIFLLLERLVVHNYEGYFNVDYFFSVSDYCKLPILLQLQLLLRPLNHHSRQETVLLGVP